MFRNRSMAIMVGITNYKFEITNSLDKLRAILRRDLLTAIRHRSGFVVTMVGVFTELAAFYPAPLVPDFDPVASSTFPFFWWAPVSTLSS